MNSSEIKTPIWAYAITILSALCIIPLGPTAIALPIFPLILAAFSTDSGTTPDSVPTTIILVGYAILFSWGILLTISIRKIREHRRMIKEQKENEAAAQVPVSEMNELQPIQKQVEPKMKEKKPWWAWTVLAFTALYILDFGVFSLFSPMIYIREYFHMSGLFVYIFNFIFIAIWIYLVVKALQIVLKKSKK